MAPCTKRTQKGPTRAAANANTGGGWNLTLHVTLYRRSLVIVCRPQPPCSGIAPAAGLPTDCPTRPYIQLTQLAHLLLALRAFTLPEAVAKLAGALPEAAARMALWVF